MITVTYNILSGKT